MSYNDIPAKVLECLVVSQVGKGSWPYDDGSNDPYWKFGTNPKDFRWEIEIEITEQRHSSHKTRQPHIYNGMDVRVGDYVASSHDGMAVRIARIDYKSDTRVRCLVEDVLRYNLFRDSSGLASGLFTVPSTAVIFGVNSTGQPVVDPLPASGVGPAFYANLTSRFQNQERATNFPITKTAHGFQRGNLVSVDPATNSFVLTDSDHPYMVGRVSYVPDADTFMVTPIQRIIDDLDTLVGEIGDILYADDSIPGNLALSGSAPAFIKLRDFTQSSVSSTVANATTTSGNVLNVNGSNVTIGGTDLDSFASSVNLNTANTGVTATVLGVPNRITTQRSTLSPQYQEVFFHPSPGHVPTAMINGVMVEFSTTQDGTGRYNMPCSSIIDMIADIERAAIPNIAVQAIDTTRLQLIETNGGAITIVNGLADTNGVYFAGLASASGLSMTSPAPSGRIVRLTAIDARPINIANRVGNPIDDFGLHSVENGQKAAALYIEQGIRQASTYVVPNILARNNLHAIIGDQAHVLDKGDGEWGLYLYDGAWKLISSYESAQTDANTLMIDVVAAALGEKLLGEVSDRSKVTLITVEVTEAFNQDVSLVIGDPANHARLASADHFDLTSLGTYIVMPSFIYEFGTDAQIRAYLTSGVAPTLGRARISVSYQ